MTSKFPVNLQADEDILRRLVADDIAVRVDAGYARILRRTWLHRWIMDAPTGMVVHHINGDTLDNRRVNLQLMTHAMNIALRVSINRNNTSGVRGVSRAKNRWIARKDIDGMRYESRHDLFEDACAAIKEFEGIANRSIH